MAWRMRRVRRVREVQQFAQAECGLCCIAMILSVYIGSRDSVAGLRRDHEVATASPSSRSRPSCAAGASRCGRSGPGGKRLISGNWPLIAYWDDSHVVVVEEIDEHRVTVVDPGGGRRRYSAEEFAKHHSASRSKPYRRRTTGPSGTGSPVSGGSSCAR
ncbi:NHLP family bacteriocin export ABC transporter peptidase/permease/ATPase [Streptomyces badius]